VIGHEFSHVLNGDMRLNVRLIGLLNGILLIGLIGLVMDQLFRLAHRKAFPWLHSRS
jgi:ABC-type nitrate/sulfonate/bicarbonate transport system permease component